MKKLYVIIDNIRSAYNVGSIFRTSDGAGVCEIHICGISPTTEMNKVAKTALGSTDSVKWQYHISTLKAIEFFKEKNIPIYSIELTSQAKDYRDVEYPDELAIILGHETEGIKQDILDLSDKHIKVPMRGKKESLNVATVAGIIIYKILE